MDNFIQAFFNHEFRMEVFKMIKYNGGPQYNTKVLIQAGYHPSFARAIVRSITRKEGW